MRAWGLQGGGYDAPATFSRTAQKKGAGFAAGAPSSDLSAF